MNINLHIESLVLDGVSVESHQRAELKAVVETQLSHLLVSIDDKYAVQSNNNARATQGGLIVFDIPPKPPALGQQIAQSVYKGIAHE